PAARRCRRGRLRRPRRPAVRTLLPAPQHRQRLARLLPVPREPGHRGRPPARPGPRRAAGHRRGRRRRAGRADGEAGHRRELRPVTGPSALAIGVDIGGTKVAAAVVDAAGRVLRHEQRRTPAARPDSIRDVVVDLVGELTRSHPVAAVGVGAAGWIDADRSVVRYAPNLAWRDELLRGLLAAALGRPVVVENDANAAAWAEFRFGAARQAAHSMVLLTVGTGIGSGIVVGGELVRGGHGMAGEIGHTRAVPDGLPCGCGRRGCLEQYASG